MPPSWEYAPIGFSMSNFQNLRKYENDTIFENPGNFPESMWQHRIRSPAARNRQNPRYLRAREQNNIQLFLCRGLRQSHKIQKKSRILSLR